MQGCNSSVLSLDVYRLGQDVRKVRERRGLTRIEAAQQAGVSMQVLQRVELGANKAGDGLIFISFWADLDLRDYVDVRLL